jgi:hypothetical protein
MEEKALTRYLSFGTCLRYLQDVRDGMIIQGKDHIFQNLERFFEHLESLNLQVTSRTTGKLEEIKNEFEGLPLDSMLSKEQAASLREEMSSIRKTLVAELGGMSAYITTPKRIDVERLTKDVSKLFSAGIFGLLPDIAKEDFSEAGKCIAFERATAAAFHILRGTEGELRSFYKKRIARKRTRGSMVQDLRKHPKIVKKYDVLLDHLDNIRRSFRNPTAHPEKFYDIDEVQNLWNLCVDAVDRMAESFEIPFPEA